MGDKRISIRTLPSGERVTHYPDGHQELIRDRSPVRERLAGKREHKRRHHDAIHQEHLRRIMFKRHRQRAKGLPHEKSPI
jgi:hypothetical protein